MRLKNGAGAYSRPNGDGYGDSLGDARGAGCGVGYDYGSVVTRGDGFGDGCGNGTGGGGGAGGHKVDYDAHPPHFICCPDGRSLDALVLHAAVLVRVTLTRRSRKGRERDAAY